MTTVRLPQETPVAETLQWSVTAFAEVLPLCLLAIAVLCSSIEWLNQRISPRRRSNGLHLAACAIAYLATCILLIFVATLAFAYGLPRIIEFRFELDKYSFQASTIGVISLAFLYAYILPKKFESKLNTSRYFRYKALTDRYFSRKLSVPLVIFSALFSVFPHTPFYDSFYDRLAQRELAKQYKSEELRQKLQEWADKKEAAGSVRKPTLPRTNSDADTGTGSGLPQQ